MADKPLSARTILEQRAGAITQRANAVAADLDDHLVLATTNLGFSCTRSAGLTFMATLYVKSLSKLDFPVDFSTGVFALPSELRSAIELLAELRPGRTGLSLDQHFGSYLIW